MQDNNQQEQNQEKKSHLRRLKSFVLRQGRMTVGQQQAYDNLWDDYGIGNKLSKSYAQTEKAKLPVLDLQTLFTKNQPINLEIGFGMGDSLVEMASTSPDKNFLGIEVHTPGVGRILQQIEKLQLKNLRVFHADAIEIIEQQIPADSLAAVYLFFPDPWHKRRHNKRRIVSQSFIKLIYSRLQKGGIFHLATDWQDYAKYMLVQLNEYILKSKTEPTENTSITINFSNQSTTDDYITRPKWRPQTKFERKGLKKGHGIWDIVFKKEEKNVKI
ncbi:MAG: tRNA (guanosine(46)-N7)-methyltransferase TrmB [Pseudomonadota bacterium]